MQPDTIVPGAANPQALNRYSYVLGNPLRYTDPTGHSQCQTQEDCDDMGTTPMGGSGQPSPAPAPGVDKEHNRKLRALQSRAELLSELMQQGDLTDTQALALLLEYSAQLYGDDKDGALMDLGIVVGGIDTTGDIPQLIDLNNPLNEYYVGYSAFDPDTGATGFLNVLNPNNDNQVRHFLAGTAAGNRGEVIQIYLVLQERAAEDKALYERAFQFVDFLNNGNPLIYAGDWVRNYLESGDTK